MNDHLPHVKVEVIQTRDGPMESLIITCQRCAYSTRRQRSQKQAWADFRRHSMPVYPMLPVGNGMIEVPMFDIP